MEKRKRILVTGGAGFIGSNLCRTLLLQGAEVDCVDNLITGRMPAIVPLKPSERFRFFLFDVADSELGALIVLPVAVEHQPHFTEDHAGRLPLLTKIKSLGWAARIDINEGLRRMLPDYGIPLRDHEVATDGSMAQPVSAW